MLDITGFDPDGKREKITEFQTANDICKQLQRAEYNSRALSKKLATFFKKSSDYETCRFIWAWLIKNIIYKAEPDTDQNAKTIARFIVDKYGDCKHYATAAVGVLNACGIPTYFSIVAQDEKKPKKPNHIYAISIVNGKQVIIDPCRKHKFDDECQYITKWSCQPIKNDKMALSYLSGDTNQTVINDMLYSTEVPPITSGTKEPLTPYLSGDALIIMDQLAINTKDLTSKSKIYLDVSNGSSTKGQYFIVDNGKRVDYYLTQITGGPAGGRVWYWKQGTIPSGLFLTPAAQKQWAQNYISQVGSKGLWDKIRDTANAAATNVEQTVQTAVTNVVNTVKTVVATVENSVSRSVFLGAVNVNAAGLALKLLNTYKVAPDEVKKTFTDMGGKWEDLRDAIAHGTGVAISNDKKRKSGCAGMSGDDQTTADIISIFKQALPYILKFFDLFKKHNTAGTAAEQQQFVQQINAANNSLASDPKIPKTVVAVPTGTGVAVIPTIPSPDASAASFFSPLGLFFKTPLILCLANVQNPLISILFAFVTMYCFVGLILFPFYQWNLLNLREFVKPFIELPKKLFYGTISKIR